jgi:hypothetical protein
LHVLAKTLARLDDRATDVLSTFLTGALQHVDAGAGAGGSARQAVRSLTDIACPSVEQHTYDAGTRIDPCSRAAITVVAVDDTAVSSKDDTVAGAGKAVAAVQMECSAHTIAEFCSTQQGNSRRRSW